MTDLPAPLTPPESDLREFAYFPLEITAVRDWRMVDIPDPRPFRAAFMLWMESWHSVPAGSLPPDDRSLARLSQAGRGWKSIKDVVLSEWILCSDGRLYHPVVARAVNRVWDSSRRVAAKFDRRLEIFSDEWANLRRKIFERDDFTCQYCSDRGVRLECDHVIPVSRGGKTVEANLVTACFPCNRSKGGRPLSDWKGRAA